MNTMKMQRSLGFWVAFITVVSLFSCIAAIPVAIKYYKEQNQTVAKAEMAVPVEKVYATAVSMAEEKDVKVLKKEDEKYYLEVTDGKQTASFKAEATDKGTTLMTIMASIPSEETKEQAEETKEQAEETKEQRKDQEKELAHRIVSRICERLNAQCTVEKE
jgi:hypothetical protein